MKNKGLLIAVVSLLLVSLFTVACAKPAPTPPPAPAPVPAPAPTPAPAPPPPAPPAKPIELRCIGWMPVDNPINDSTRELIKRVNERAKGELIIKFAGGAEVMPGFEQYRALIGGVIEMIHTPTGYYPDLLPAGWYFTFTEITPWEEREVGFYDLMLKEHLKVGMYYLGRTMVPTGFQAFLRKPVETPRQLAGLKFRSAPVYDPFIKALGGVAVTMGMPDVYTGLERGVVDGAFQPLDGGVDLRWHEVAPYIIEHGFYDMNTVWLLNPGVWNKIPKHLQDMIINTAKEVERWTWDHRAEVLKTYRQKALDQGAKFIKFSPEDAKYFVELAYSSGWAKCKEVSPQYYDMMRGMLLKKK